MHRIEQVTKIFNATLIQPQLKTDTKLSLNGKDEFLDTLYFCVANCKLSCRTNTLVLKPFKQSHQEKKVESS